MSEERLVITSNAEEGKQGMANDDMVHYWNGRPADLWVAEAARFDTMLAPFGSRLLRAVNLELGEQVLDVGCGDGAISLEAARSVGPPAG